MTKKSSETNELNSNDDLCFIIKNARNERNLSQRKFAELIGITQTQLCRLENDNTIKPAKKTLKLLAPYIGLSYAELLARYGYFADATMPIEENEEIDTEAIIAELNKVEPSFLNALSGISMFGSDNNDIMLLTKILNMMKKIALHDIDQSEILKYQLLREYLLQAL